MKSDLELFLDYRRGNRAAFHRLVRRHFMGVFNLAYVLAGDEKSGEELAERTFCHLFTDRQKLRQGVTFATYLYQSVIARWNDTRLPAKPRTESAPATDGLSVLDGLPPESRVILALREVSRLGYREIGAVLELQPAAVAHRMNEAFQQAGACLKASLPGPDDAKHKDTSSSGAATEKLG